MFGRLSNEIQSGCDFHSAKDTRWKSCLHEQQRLESTKATAAAEKVQPHPDAAQRPSGACSGLVSITYNERNGTSEIHGISMQSGSGSGAAAAKSTLR